MQDREALMFRVPRAPLEPRGRGGPGRREVGFSAADWTRVEDGAGQEARGSASGSTSFGGPRS